MCVFPRNKSPWLFSNTYDWWLWERIGTVFVRAVGWGNACVCLLNHLRRRMAIFLFFCQPAPEHCTAHGEGKRKRIVLPKYWIMHDLNDIFHMHALFSSPESVGFVLQLAWRICPLWNESFTTLKKVSEKSNWRNITFCCPQNLSLGGITFCKQEGSFSYNYVSKQK